MKTTVVHIKSPLSFPPYLAGLKIRLRGDIWDCVNGYGKIITPNRPDLTGFGNLLSLKFRKKRSE
jgi:hypothetical protein